MEILPVVKLMEEDLEPLEAENESEEETGDTIEMEIKDEVLPEVKKAKPTIQEEDIFVDKDKPKEKPKKEKKPRKPMTETQLEHLRKGREKALAVRRAKAQEKKEIKELVDYVQFCGMSANDKDKNLDLLADNERQERLKIYLKCKLG